MLELKGVTKRFGGIVAVDALDLRVGEGEIVGLIGPNGSGKTVTVNLCTGVYRPDAGTISFQGQVLNRCREWEIHRLGITRTFQTIRLWGRLSVLENLMVAYSGFMPATSWEVLLRGPRARREEAEARAASLRALKMVGMAAFADKPAGDLSFGQQRLVELARALVARPKCVLLDEPAAGLKSELIVQLGKLIKSLNQEQGVAFLVVEHRTRLVMDICSTVVVLDHGVKIAEGTPRSIGQDERVITAYLGRKRTRELGRGVS